MKARFFRSENKHVIKMGNVLHLKLLPVVGQEVVWRDDKSYEVVNVAWDFYTKTTDIHFEGEVVIELRLR